MKIGEKRAVFGWSSYYKNWYKGFGAVLPNTVLVKAKFEDVPIGRFCIHNLKDVNDTSKWELKTSEDKAHWFCPIHNQVMPCVPFNGTEVYYTATKEELNR